MPSVSSISSVSSTSVSPVSFPTHSFDDPLIGDGAPGFAIGSFADLAPWSSAPYPHRHEFYELVCVTGGTGTHVIDFVPYKVTPTTMYFVAPGQVQFWEGHTPLEGYIVTFVEEFLVPQYGDRVSPRQSLALDPLGTGHALHLAPEEVEPVTTLLAALVREYQRPGGTDVSVLQAYLHILLVEMRRFSRGADVRTVEEDSGTALARRYLRLVSEELPYEQSVSGYASRIGVTPKHLADVVKRTTGKRPAEIIRAALTVEAKRLLRHTDLTVAQVSQRLLFDNPSYFGRFFKRETGTSPGEFRRRAGAADYLRSVTRPPT